MMAYREDDHDQHVADELVIESVDDADMYRLFSIYLAQADHAGTMTQAVGALLQCLHAVHYLLREKEARG